jgi:hypothetical protein
MKYPQSAIFNLSVNWPVLNDRSKLIEQNLQNYCDGSLHALCHATSAFTPSALDYYTCMC